MVDEEHLARLRGAGGCLERLARKRTGHQHHSEPQQAQRTSAIGNIMSQSRAEALTALLDDLATCNFSLNAYYDYLEVQPVIDNELTGKINSLLAFCKIFGWPELVTYLQDMTPLQGDAVQSLAVIQNFIIPEARWLLSVTDTDIDKLKNPHRPMSEEEVKRKRQLADYINNASEDNIIQEVLLPLFRQLGFHRITAAGHKDKALEYGKDIWMRYSLPTQHFLYFGLQVKKGKLDSAGATRPRNANVAEIMHQSLMMIGHEIFDPEVNRKVLVDHVFIVAGGEITKAARNWLGGKLDATQRSQIMFIDRYDILTPIPQMTARQGDT